MDWKGRRLNDLEVREIIEAQCGATTVSEFQRLAPEEQENVIIEAKSCGASIRQLMSHTGWTYRRVRDAGKNETDNQQ